MSDIDYAKLTPLDAKDLKIGELENALASLRKDHAFECNLRIEQMAIANAWRVERDMERHAAELEKLNRD